MLEQLAPAVDGLLVLQVVVHHQLAVLGHDGIELRGGRVQLGTLLGRERIHDGARLVVAHAGKAQAVFLGAAERLHAVPLLQVGHRVGHGPAQDGQLDVVGCGLDAPLQRRDGLGRTGAAGVDHGLVRVALGQHAVGFGRMAGVQVFLEVGQLDLVLGQLLDHRIELLSQEVLGTLGGAAVVELFALVGVELILDLAGRARDGGLHSLGVDQLVLQLVDKVVEARHAGLGPGAGLGRLLSRGAGSGERGIGRESPIHAGGRRVIAQLLEHLLDQGARLVVGHGAVLGREGVKAEPLGHGGNPARHLADGLCLERVIPKLALVDFRQLGQRLINPAGAGVGHAAQADGFPHVLALGGQPLLGPDLDPQIPVVELLHLADILAFRQESTEPVMDKLVPQRLDNLRDGPVGVPEEIDFPADGRAFGGPRTCITHVREAGYAVQNDDGRLMSKLTNAFFNRLRNLCL